MSESIAAQIVVLQEMTVAELRQRWEQVFGEPTSQRHKQYLIKRIAWEIQRQHDGQELSAEAKACLHDLQEEFRTTPPSEWFKGARHNRAPATSAPTRTRLARSPGSPKPGSVLTRTYRGERVAVTVRDHREFEWEGEIFRSLSAVAKAITGSHCSGVAFFGLNNREVPR